VPADRRVEPCLGEAELGALVEVARLVERHFGRPQDIEWAIARGQALPEALLVLQSRPVTSLPDPRPKLSASAISLVMGTFGAPAPEKRS
jgi:pyruvate,water dikinase